MVSKPRVLRVCSDIPVLAPQSDSKEKIKERDKGAQEKPRRDKAVSGDSGWLILPGGRRREGKRGSEHGFPSEDEYTESQT